jgi:ABC-type multidrug transport system fused ATPase/permease subunit
MKARDRPHPLSGVWTARSICCRSWRVLWILSHFWLTPFLCKALHVPVSRDDIWRVPEQLGAEREGARFAALRRRKPNQRLYRTLAEAYWPQWAHAGMWYIVWCFCAGFQPFAVRDFLLFLSTPSAPLWHGLLIVAIFSASLVGYLYTINIKFSLLVENGVAMRSALVVALAKKSLRLSSAARTDAGSLTNLMSNDTETIFEMQLFLHYLWASSAFVVVVVALVLNEIGPSGLVGFALLLLAVPVQALLGKCVGARKRRMLAETDARTGFFAECLQGIEIVKLCGWEAPFAARLERARRAELQELACTLVLRALMRTINFLLAPFVGFVTLWVYVALGNTLSLETSLMTLSFFNILRFPLLLIPHAVALLFEGVVSIERIERFLLLPEHESAPDEGRADDGEGDGELDEAVALDGVVLRIDAEAIAWGNADGAEESAAAAGARCNFALRNLRLDVLSGALVGVVGAVGSGKSLLCHACLGEVPARRSGGGGGGGSGGGSSGVRRAGVHRVIAYQAQASPIANATLAENVRMGAPPDDSSDASLCVALWGACLVEDALRLPAGVASEIGERGVNVSGGQRARIAFARVLYVFAKSHLEGGGAHDARAPLLSVLDDPLSAVDIAVAHRMYRRGILGVILTRAVACGNEATARDARDFDRLAGIVSHDAAARARALVARLAKTALEEAAAPAQQAAAVRPRPGVVLVLSAHTELLSAHTSPRDSVLVLAGSPASGPSSVLVQGSYAECLPAFPAAYEPRASGPIYTEVWEMVGMDLLCGARSSSERSRSAAPPGKEAEGVQLEEALGTSANEGRAGRGPGDVAAAPASCATSADVPAAGSLTTAEVRAVGNVQLGSILKYFAVVTTGSRCANGVLAVAIVTLLLAVLATAQASRMMIDTTIAWWSDPRNERSNSVPSEVSTRFASRSDPFWFTSVLIWLSVAGVLSLARALGFVAIAVRASKLFHTRVLTAVVQAPLLFFQRTPTGRIQNLFSSDMHRLDIQLPDNMEDLGVVGTNLVGALVLSCIAVPWLVGVVAITLPLAWLCQRVYRAANRELQRLDGTSRSFVYSLFQRAVSMRVSIRAFRAQDVVRASLFAVVDSNATIYLVNRLLERWISVHLNLLCAVTCAALMLAAALLRGSELAVDASIAGLAIVYSLQLMGLCSWAVRALTRVEGYLTSVERLDALTAVPPAPLTTKEPALAAGAAFAERGKIVFKRVSLRYGAAKEHALDRLSFEIEAKSKVGVVGRTGAGKSSIIAALFRLFECEVGSSIEIDGVDIATVPLPVLRKRLSCIPQTPVIFRGTFRSNLNPLDDPRVTDATLWEALRKTELAAVVRAAPHGLDTPIMGGAIAAGNGKEALCDVTLSFGQRQLLCICRALLMRSAILVCDEATSSVDTRTDSVIQNVIRREFRNRTVITVAHRLSTVMHCDQIIVMDAGRCVEIGSPAALAADASSRFAQMLRTAV